MSDKGIGGGPVVEVPTAYGYLSLVPKSNSDDVRNSTNSSIMGISDSTESNGPKNNEQSTYDKVLSQYFSDTTGDSAQNILKLLRNKTSVGIIVNSFRKQGKNPGMLLIYLAVLSNSNPADKVAILKNIVTALGDDLNDSNKVGIINSRYTELVILFPEAAEFFRAGIKDLYDVAVGSKNFAETQCIDILDIPVDKNVVDIDLTALELEESQPETIINGIYDLAETLRIEAVLINRTSPDDGKQLTRIVNKAINAEATLFTKLNSENISINNRINLAIKYFYGVLVGMRELMPIGKQSEVMTGADVEKYTSRYRILATKYGSERLAA